MDTDRTAAVEAILAQTEAAHGDYEASELHGVYDDAWATWYALYAVDHGIGEALGRPVSAAGLAALFTSSWAARAATEPGSSEAWGPWMARRLVADC